MRFVIGFILLVSSCSSEHQPHGPSNQNSYVDSNEIQKVSKKTENIKAALKQTQTANSTAVTTDQISATKQGPCNCGGGICGCCSKLLFDVWKQKACVNVTYDPDEFSFTTKVLMNDRILYTRSVSGKFSILGLLLIWALCFL